MPFKKKSVRISLLLMIILPVAVLRGSEGKVIIRAGSNSRMINLSNQEKEFIKKNNPLTFSEIDWKPMSVADKPGMYDGLIADYLKLISEKTGLEFQFISARTWQQVLEKYLKHEIDFIPAIVQEDVTGRDIVFSDEFVSFPLVIVTRENVSFIKETSELNGRKVAAGHNYTSAVFIKKNYPKINLVETENVEQGLIMLSNGEVDAFVDHMAICIEYMEKLGIKNLKIGGITEFRFHHRIGLDPDRKTAAAIINRAIAAISADEHRGIYSKWINVAFEKPFNYDLLFRVLALAMLVIAAVIIWIRKLSRFNDKLRKEINERTIAEERLSVALTASGIGMWENKFPEGESFFSDQMFIMLGYEPLPLDEAHDFFRRIIHPDDAERVKNIISDFLYGRKKGLYRIEFRLKNSSGSYTDILSVGKVLERDVNGMAVRMVGVHLDISDFRRAEAAIRASENRLKKLVNELREANDRIRREMDERVVSEKRFRDIADLLPQMIYECDADGVITYTNRFGFEFTGYNEDFIGRINFREFLSDEDRLVALENIRLAVGGGNRLKNEYRFIKRDGTVVPVLLYSSLIMNEGAFAGLRGIVIDISDRKRIEEALVAANRAKSEFLANVSHEIRTPLNAIMGLANIVLGGNLDPGQRKYVEKINSSALSLLGIINDMLDYSKIEAGRLELEEIDFRLEDVLVNLAELLTFSADEHDMEILIDLEPDVPCRLRGDPLRLGQVLVNLASNAIKFGLNRDVIIHVWREPRAGNEAGEVALFFSVTDRGIGMTEEQIGRLFRPFAQADSSTTRRFGGTGLGLVICKQIADLMHGEIDVKSEPGKGSVFTFSVVMKISEPAEGANAGIRCDYSGIRVLAVDDSEASCRIIKSSVERLNALCEAVTDPAEAVHLAVAAMEEGKSFHVVMADYKMSGIDGIDCIRNIKDACGDVMRSILMISPYGRDLVLSRAKEAGIEVFLDRPVFRSSLINTLNELLKMEPDVSPDISKPAKGDSPKNRDIEMLKKIGGLKVLIVEDNRTNQMVLSAFAEKAGMKTAFAENGAICLEAVEKEAFDMILMDIQMPVMDGYEASRELRKRGVNIPIIGVSAHAFTGERENCINAGMNDYISKPVSPPDMYKKMLALLTQNA